MRSAELALEARPASARVRVSPYEGGACTDDSVTGAQEKGGGGLSNTR
eukprot:COSAG01_NODE_2104_length_8418_cov_94.839644_4_plen_48_part_00